jgi:REP element-mobilizing transposase RayT
MLTRLCEIIEQRCRDRRGTLAEFNGESDHIHILMSLPPNLDLSHIVNNLKTTSSRLIRRDFADHLKRVYRKLGVLVPLVLHHLVQRSPVVDHQTIHRTAGKSGLSRGALHREPRASALARALGDEPVERRRAMRAC